MILFPAVIIHGVDHARTALAPGAPVLLLSAPGAAGFAGVGWWQAVICAAQAAFPATPCQHVLDCAADPGRALEALSAGQKLIVFAPAAPGFSRIHEIATACDAWALDARPAALDLAARNTARELPQWLGIKSQPDDGQAS